jgi:hypothetical protein
VKTSRAGARKTTHPQARRCPTAQWAHRDTGTSEGGRSPRTPASSPLHFGGDVCLPSGVERLLLDVVADGFVLYCCGPRAAGITQLAAPTTPTPPSTPTQHHPAHPPR